MWEQQLPSKQPQQPTSCCESLPEDAVPRRTLGPHQAEDIEWDKIDALLKEVQDDEVYPGMLEYLNFLSTLQSEVLEDMQGEDGEDNDPDYKESEDQERVASKTYDSEEYRDDRAVRVSQKEMDSLLASYEALLQQEPETKPLLSIYPEVRLTIPSLCEPVVTEGQMNEIRKQLTQHFQLLVQVHLRSLQNTQECSSTTDTTWKLLCGLRSFKDILAQRKVDTLTYDRVLSPGVMTRSMRKRQHSISSPISPQQTVLQAPFSNTTSPMSAQLQHNVPNAPPVGNNFQELDIRDRWSSNTSILDIPALTLFDFLHNQLQKPQVNIQTIQDAFKPHFDPTLKPTYGQPLHRSAGRARFTPAEDTLLALGLQRYGLKGIERIQQNLLPTKTTTEIKNRYKNLGSKTKTGWNMIKEWKESTTKSTTEEYKPLTAMEQDLIITGVAFHGYKWEQIAKEFLPHRSADALQWLWNKVQKDRISGASNQNKPTRFQFIPQSSLPGPYPVSILFPDHLSPSAEQALPTFSGPSTCVAPGSASAVSLPYTCNPPQTVLDALDFEEEMMSDSESDTDSFEFSDFACSDSELSSEDYSSKSESDDTMSPDKNMNGLIELRTVHPSKSTAVTASQYGGNSSTLPSLDSILRDVTFDAVDMSDSDVESESGSTKNTIAPEEEQETEKSYCPPGDLSTEEEKEAEYEEDDLGKETSPTIKEDKDEHKQTSAHTSKINTNSTENVVQAQGAWTKDEDRLILQAAQECTEHLPQESTWKLLASSQGGPLHRSIAQIGHRYKFLVDLFLRQQQQKQKQQVTIIHQPPSSSAQ